jgi:5'-3' exonuclease
MGVKHFWIWFKNNFGHNIASLKHDQNFKNINTKIDNLMIDMNGVIHNSAQKIYEYGNHKPLKSSLLKNSKKIRVNHKLKEENLFKDVCNTIDNIFKITSPEKKLVLCIDGVAPLCKATQQRSRRFRSAFEKSEEEFASFDQNKISPGTKFMDNLTRYIDWYIRKKVSTDKSWQDIEIIFSNEKVAGEGEHTILDYIRYHGNDNDTYCINGLDADLIMLSLVSHKPNFYVLREDLYDKENAYFNINIGNTRKNLVDIMKWDGGCNFIPESAINDFVFLCFMTGNDFLPHIPSIEILEGGIDIILDVYKSVGKIHGHITKKIDNKIVFDKSSLEAFMGTISFYEKDMFENKINRKHSFFPDPLLEKHCKFIDSSLSLNLENYRSDYMKTMFPENISEEKICHDYIEGLQWVISYYVSGISNWTWNYPYHYAPFAHHIKNHIKTFNFRSYSNTKPATPYQQLLTILPPRSSKLLPEPLANLLTNPDSPMNEFCPSKLDIDLAGKRKEWEGIVLLPMVKKEVVDTLYFSTLSKIDNRELSRNKSGKSFKYNYNPDNIYTFKSYYGNIDHCTTKVTMFDI